jgi:hypothetical protein
VEEERINLNHEKIYRPRIRILETDGDLTRGRLLRSLRSALVISQDFCQELRWTLIGEMKAAILGLRAHLLPNRLLPRTSVIKCHSFRFKSVRNESEPIKTQSA